MLEAYIEQKGSKLVKEQGGFYLKLSALRFAGLPDRLVLLKHAVLAFIEVKKDGGVLSPKQIHVHKKLKALGFRVYTVFSHDELFTVIQKLVKESDARA